MPNSSLPMVILIFLELNMFGNCLGLFGKVLTFNN